MFTKTRFYFDKFLSLRKFPKNYHENVKIIWYRITLVGTRFLIYKGLPKWPKNGCERDCSSVRFSHQCQNSPFIFSLLKWAILRQRPSCGLESIQWCLNGPFSLQKDGSYWHFSFDLASLDSPQHQNGPFQNQKINGPLGMKTFRIIIRKFHFYSKLFSKAVINIEFPVLWPIFGVRHVIFLLFYGRG